MDFLYSAVGFVIAIGVLVTIHEYGHFQVARWCGIKVLKFSVGFGKPLIQRTGKDGVVYCLAAIPLGGYVKMLDEREGDVPEELLPVSFNRQSVWKRIAVVVAGPAANFIFAIAAYWLLFVTGIPGIVSEIGSVEPDSPAAVAGLQAGQRIESVNGYPTPTWRAARMELFQAASKGETATLVVSQADADLGSASQQLQLPTDNVNFDTPNILPQLGLGQWRSTLPIEPLVGTVLENSPASRAGFKTGDRVLSVDEQPVPEWGDWVTYVRERPGKLLAVTVERDGAEVKLEVIPETAEHEGETYGRVGVGLQYSEALQADLEAHTTMQHYGPLAAIPNALRESWSLSVLTLRMLGKMLVGEASWKQIGGPIQIAQYAGGSLQSSLNDFLSVLALISISLGVLNLLPIPVLDGGHLLYYVAEIFKGSPVSLETQAFGQRIGITLLLMLMTVAFYNDLARIF